MLPEALILCGGRSRRFGSDKAFADVCGRPVIERVMDALSPVSSRLRLVADEDSRFASLGLPVILDREPHAGPLAALAHALPMVSTPLCYVASCDMPFLSSAYFHMLRDVMDDAEACMPFGAEIRAPLAALYRTDVASKAAENRARGGRRLVRFVEELRLRALTAEELRSHPPELLLNLNTPEDAARAEEILRRRA